LYPPTPQSQMETAAAVVKNNTGRRINSARPIAGTANSNPPITPSSTPARIEKMKTDTVMQQKRTRGRPLSAICDNRKLARYGRSVANLISQFLYCSRLCGGRARSRMVLLVLMTLVMASRNRVVRRLRVEEAAVLPPAPVPAGEGPFSEDIVVCSSKKSRMV